MGEKRKLFYKTDSLRNFVLSLITDYIGNPYTVEVDDSYNCIILDIDKSDDLNRPILAKIPSVNKDLNNEDKNYDEDIKYNNIEFFKSIEIEFDFNYPLILLPFINLELSSQVQRG